MEGNRCRIWKRATANRYQCHLVSQITLSTTYVPQVQREVNSIENKYDGDLGGTVYLKTGSSMSGPWTTKKTWTMKLR